MPWLDTAGSARPEDFSPPLLRIQKEPPSPLAGWVFRVLSGLVVFVGVWAALGTLDIVAVADGKLVPDGYLKIVQPAEQGVVKEILVREGERVSAGQPLIRMDPVLTEADVKTVRIEYHNRRLALRRIDAELLGSELTVLNDDPGEILARVQAQYAANVRAYQNALAQERSVLQKAKHDLAAAQQTKSKLEQVLPHYLEQEAAFARLVKDGFVGRIVSNEKARDRIEKEQDLRTQESVIQSNLALIEQSEKRLAQIDADYRRQLQSERVEVAAQLERSRQDLAKHEHRHGLLELRAPQDATVKDLATHTAGTVVAPGTILMTLVPQGEPVVVEVWIDNKDVGFVRPGQPVKVKLTPFQFQKYGMVAGRVRRVSTDATEAPSANTRSDTLGGRDRPIGPLSYRAIVELDDQTLAVHGATYSLAAGMQAIAEIHLGERTVLEYLLSPVRKAFHEAGRER